MYSQRYLCIPGEWGVVKKNAYASSRVEFIVTYSSSRCAAKVLLAW